MQPDQLPAPPQLNFNALLAAERARADALQAENDRLRAILAASASAQPVAFIDNGYHGTATPPQSTADTVREEDYSRYDITREEIDDATKRVEAMRAADAQRNTRLSELVLELAEAVDNAAHDIGGCRPQLTILREAVQIACRE